MKNIFKVVGVLTLVFFSFFYTEKVIDVINEQDEIMIKLNEIKDNYKIDSSNAIIKDDTIVPGINGKEIDVEKSYKNMKKVGIFDSSLIKYKKIIPDISINNNKDKYIISGNKNNQKVALIFKLASDNDKLLSLLEDKKIKANIFISYDYLVENMDNIFKENLEFYSYGNNGGYSNDILLLSNNIINRKSNLPRYCLSENRENNTLEICKKNDMYTIYPTIINANYSSVKLNLENGSIISFDRDINELGTIINYITSKGYKISYLSELLSE